MASKLLLKKKCLHKCKKNQMKNEITSTNISSVDEMTSRDFHGDIQAHIGVIAYFIKDKPHCDLYRNTILYNKHLFKGRTVLNIGCSVGLLALFAAQADAACVYAVDESNAIDYARRVVEDNKFEHVIKLYKTNIKQLQLPVAQVDIILCDWCGYSLFFQSQCAEVIYARDKWLKPNGIIMPDMAKLYIGGFEDEHHKYERFDWWLNVYGFNMKALRTCALQEPCYQQLRQQQVISTVYPVHTLDLNKASLKDLKFRSKYLLHFNATSNIDGVFTYFEVIFSKSHTPAYITTAPSQPYTRWLQTLFFFDQPVRVRKDEELCGGFEMYPLKEGDMNNMQARLELLSGDPALDLHLEVAMSWRLKPASVCKNIQDEEMQVKQEQKPNITNSKPTVTTTVENEKPIMHENNNSMNNVTFTKMDKKNKRGNKNHHKHRAAINNEHLPNFVAGSENNFQRGRHPRKTKN